MIIITGEVLLQPGRREEAVALGCEHSARSRSEDGCLAHNCYMDAEDPLRMHFFEKWRDMAAVQKHFAVPESAQFVSVISTMASAPPEIAIFNAEQIEPAAA